MEIHKPEMLRCLYRSRHHICGHDSWKGTFPTNSILFLSFEWKTKWKMTALLASDSTSVTLSFHDLVNWRETTGPNAGCVPEESSESEQSLPKRFLMNYKVFSLHWHATSPLLPPPRLSLSMAATPGHALLPGGEARHVWSVQASLPRYGRRLFGAVCQATSCWRSLKSGAGNVTDPARGDRSLVKERTEGNKQIPQGVWSDSSRQTRLEGKQCDISVG